MRLVCVHTQVHKQVLAHWVQDNASQVLLIQTRIVFFFSSIRSESCWSEERKLELRFVSNGIK